VIEEDQRAALLDKLFQRRRAFFTQPAAILGRHASGAMALRDLLAWLIWNHDGVEPLL
jgi:hypothetical protein